MKTNMKFLVDSDGNKFWYNENNQLHREGGPAVEWLNGCSMWYYNGYLHRVDGPAFELPSGSKFWYFRGSYHREDGPAIEYFDRSVKWYLNGNNMSKSKYFFRIRETITKKIGKEIAEMFEFDWKNHFKAIVLADYIEEQGDTKTANQIRNLIKFASC